MRRECIPHEFLPVMHISGSSGKLIQEWVGRKEDTDDEEKATWLP
jgi:hypothetical protein